MTPVCKMEGSGRDRVVRRSRPAPSGKVGYAWLQLGPTQ